MSSSLKNKAELIAEQLMGANINKKMWDSILYNVKDFGAKSDGLTDDSAAVQKAIDAAAVNYKKVFIPYNTNYNQANLTIPRNVIIWDESDGYIDINDYVSDNAKSTLVIRRDNNEIGGTPGQTLGALVVYDTVRNGVTSYEWGLTVTLYNEASAGENTAIYGRGVKMGTGPTWAATFEADDKTHVKDPTTGLIGVEIDIWANDTDANLQRACLDIVVGKDDPAGVAPAVTHGIRIGPKNGDSTEGSFLRGIYTQGNMTNGILMAHSGTWGLRMTGALATGIDLSGATMSGAGIRMKDGMKFSFDATDNFYMKLDAAGNKLEFYKGATRVGYIDFLGADHVL